MEKKNGLGLNLVICYIHILDHIVFMLLSVNHNLKNISLIR